MTTIALPFIEGNKAFPAPTEALEEPNGLLCFGGDLSPNRLVDAYRNGIFPWFSEGEPILWWSPTPRALIQPNEFHASKSLKKHIRKNSLKITVNQCFQDVIETCAEIPRIDAYGTEQGTWITWAMKQAYIDLHEAGFAHSVEVWRNDKMIGGLYGVVTDGVFCGESMFHKETNASKVAMFALVSLLKPYQSAFIDCQLPTEHLSSLGAKSVPRESFLSMLKQANNNKMPSTLWEKREVTLAV